VSRKPNGIRQPRTRIPVLASWLFLFAYTCSGFAGLVYEVSWTRLLTLYIGHTTAAAAAVVAAFLGGLAAGAALGGMVAPRFSPRRNLQAYIGLECFVGLAALVLPFELAALTPLLRWAYSDGAPGILFPTIRLLTCLLMVFVPAAALGATFPMAVRWFATDSNHAAQSSGLLYALNTLGAAVGALLAGFVLIPAIGLSGTTWVGVTASAAAAVAVLLLLRAAVHIHQPAVPRRRAKTPDPALPDRAWLAALVLGVSGFAALVHEIAWTRILALVLGPTIYAFAATLAAVISGVAIGSAAGTWLTARTRQPATWLALTLALAAMATSWTYALAGERIPAAVAQQVASSSNLFADRLQQGLLLTAALILPTSLCLGAAFPLALALAGGRAELAATRFANVYAVNTIGAVSGSLAAGFLLIPFLGLQATLAVVCGCLVVATLIVLYVVRLSNTARGTTALMAGAAAMLLVFSPPWDRELLASGAYLYAPFVPKDLDLETLLKAGTLLYYREGASATVSVKRLTGTTTLAVDGKTDASNRGDMLTQKLAAHLPLLLHENPREVAIVGFGSGVTVGAALRHPVARVDVVEISREVIEASRFFAAENHDALSDPRMRLIIGDGRSHLLLSQHKYDVIISEPSNPWIAGVSALFTREFFLAARERLAPGGLICQWANAYSISDRDLRSIVATFLSVFPDGTAWLMGADDVLLVASSSPLDSRLANIEGNWHRPGVATDLAEVSALEPFSVWSLLVGGPKELARYSAGAPLLNDDRMTLEFSSPRELHGRSAGENGATLASLLKPDEGPSIIVRAKASATAAEWRNRGGMMARRDANGAAYDDYVRALMLDREDGAALAGLVRTAILTHRAPDALAWVKSLGANAPPTASLLIATSKLLASIDAHADAVDAAKQASRITPDRPEALEQLASLYADAGNPTQLDATVAELRRIANDGAAMHYFAAVSAFLRGQAVEAAASAERAVAIDPAYAPVYDLLGAAYTKLEKRVEAQEAFRKSLSFDAHDSTAYTNLGLLELAVGNRDAAKRYFAEALWLAPQSTVAREGLARAK
jgi:spermidine synthase